MSLSALNHNGLCKRSERRLQGRMRPLLHMPVLGVLGLTLFFYVDSSAIDAPPDTAFYGQVNKSFMVFADGGPTRAAIVDNNVSSTRFGWKAEKNIHTGLKASALFEVQASGNSSARVSQLNSTALNGAGILGIRHGRVGLSGPWGAFFLGHTSSATDGITELDLGGVTDVLSSSPARWGGGLSFRREDGIITNITLAQVTDGFDGIAFSGGSASDGTDRYGNGFADRFSLIRYNSPRIKNTEFSFAYTQGGAFDIAARYKVTYAHLGTIAAGLGYVRYDTGTSTLGQNKVRAQFSGSVSAKQPSGWATGLGITLAAGVREYRQKAPNIKTPWFFYSKLNYDVMPAWALAAEFGHYNSIDTTFAGKSYVNLWGLGMQYALSQGASVAFYGRELRLQRIGMQTDPLRVFGANIRVKF